MKQEYKDFFGAEEIAPPSMLTKKIFNNIKEDLEPSSGKVFKKFLVLHLFTSLLSLAVCPQFGVGFLGGSHGLLSPVMHYGPVVCAATCGSVFLGISAVLAVLFLRIEELKTIYKKGIWQYSFIAVASWFLLMCIGDPQSFEFTAIWIVSGTMSATLIQTLGTTLKRRTQVPN